MKGRMSAMEAIMLADLRKKEQEKERERNQGKLTNGLQKNEVKVKNDYWLAPGIVVKVINKKMLDGKYYKVHTPTYQPPSDCAGAVSQHACACPYTP